MPIATTVAATTGSKAIVVGAAVASSSLLADLVIFQDPDYLKIALAGSIVSTFGVIHEISNRSENISCTKQRVFGKILKGVFVGFMAIPFLFLLLNALGEATISHMLGVSQLKVANSLWLIISFSASWFSVQIFDFVVKFVSGFFRKKKRKYAGGDEGGES